MAETSANDPASLIAQDLPKAIANLNDIKNVVKSVNTMIANITNRIKKKELPTNEGMSFLDVKNQMLIQYLTNLAVLFLRKCSGESIKDTIAVEHLVEIRTILERMRPVEHKLKYQIEKLLKLASEGKLGENDPLQFKANPNNLISKVEEDSSDEDDDKKDKKSGAYVPPKIASMHYEGDIDQQTSKAAEKTQRHKLSASAMQGLREEYMDTPVEIAEFSANGTRMKIAKERQERIDYEEKYFTRLPSSRQDRHSSRLQHSSKAFADELVGISSSRTEGKGKRKNMGKKKGPGFKKRRKN